MASSGILGILMRDHGEKLEALSVLRRRTQNSQVFNWRDSFPNVVLTLLDVFAVIFSVFGSLLVSRSVSSGVDIIATVECLGP